MPQNTTITLQLIGFNTTECNNVNAILTLAERALSQKWETVTHSDADFFLLSVSACSQLESDPQLKSLPSERCMYCITRKEHQTNHSVFVGEEQIPSLRSLVDLFNRVATEIHLNIPATAAPVSPSQTDSSAFFDASATLLGYLLATKEYFLSVNLTSDSKLPPLFIDVNANSYYTPLKLQALKPYIIASLDELNIQSLTPPELKTQIESAQLDPKKIKDLVWFSVISHSNGRAIKGYTPTDIVSLKSWPDLKLPQCSRYTKLATFMKNNATTLPTVAEKTNFPLEEVYTFYNACYMIGLIEHKTKIKLKQKEIDSQRLELITKISSRLQEQ